MLMDEHINENNLHHWLTLLHASARSHRNLSHLLDQFKTAEAIIEAVKDGSLNRSHLPEKTLKSLQAPDWEKIDQDREWLQDQHHHLITLTSQYYPPLLKYIPAPPVGLFVEGEPDILTTPQVAIVGSRKPTVEGRRCAFNFAAELVRENITITSGMAYGIDTEAHRGALSGQGGTIAVLGSGLNRIYPKPNKELAEKISENGLLVSEFPVTTGPFAQNFPRRNRIISGLSAGVLIIEAAERSGSLITANHALEQNREVFAIPGSINNPLKKGCHNLIQNGAKLVGDVDDILEELPAFASPVSVEPDPGKGLSARINKLDEAEKALLEHIGYDPVSIDEMMCMTKMNVEDVISKLLKLELDGLISILSPGVYIRN